AAAHSLREGFLGSQFGQSNLDQAEVSRIHRIEAFKENAILLAGDDGSVAGVMERSAQAARSVSETKNTKSEKARRSANNMLYLDLLQHQSAALGREIANLEANFEAEHGDA
ncbi:hypothetical protein, partial [Janibacter hoylei]|uniref:hypothetical protein n=1 Tax=Janibacter hoylei TaxID=364298 RepID=UPI002492A6EB